MRRTRLRAPCSLLAAFTSAGRDQSIGRRSAHRPAPPIRKPARPTATRRPVARGAQIGPVGRRGRQVGSRASDDVKRGPAADRRQIVGHRFAAKETRDASPADRGRLPQIATNRVFGRRRISETSLPGGSLLRRRTPSTWPARRRASWAAVDGH